jgi:hypothetical protein
MVFMEATICHYDLLLLYVSLGCLTFLDLCTAVKSGSSQLAGVGLFNVWEFCIIGLVGDQYHAFPFRW